MAWGEPHRGEGRWWRVAIEAEYADPERSRRTLDVRAVRAASSVEACTKAEGDWAVWHDGPESAVLCTRVVSYWVNDEEVYP